MRYGVCFDHDDVGVYATPGHGPEYLWQRLRDLVDGCWIKESSTRGRNEGQIIVGTMDRYIRDLKPIPRPLLDEALEFLQHRTSEGLKWRISGEHLELRPTRE